MGAEPDWRQVLNPETVRGLMSNTHTEFEFNDGQWHRGFYDDSGSAELRHWGGRMERTWFVTEDAKVCYRSVTQSCFRLYVNPRFARDLLIEADDGQRSRVLFINKERSISARNFNRPAPGSISHPSAQEIASELSDPATSLPHLDLLLDYRGFGGSQEGADDARGTTLSLRPVLSYDVEDHVRFALRPLLPIVLEQDIAENGGGTRSADIDLADLSVDGLVIRRWPSGLELGAGVAGRLPTATDNALGLDQWLLGPAVLVALHRPWGTLGLRLSQQLDVAGDGDRDTELTLGEYFYALNLGKGWQLASEPVFSYDHRAASGDEWSLPVGVGLWKTVEWRDRPWRMGIEYWHYVEQLDTFGPEFQIRLRLTPVLPRRIGGLPL
ncbi:MAG: hypothetical protein AAGA91_10705 [Pseudomonadota bacterium]